MAGLLPVQPSQQHGGGGTLLETLNGEVTLILEQHGVSLNNDTVKLKQVSVYKCLPKKCTYFADLPVNNKEQ